MAGRTHAVLEHWRIRVTTDTVGGGPVKAALPPRPGRKSCTRVAAVGTGRDRRGRGLRGPLAWPPVPAMTSRTARFDALVLDAAEALERRLGHELGVELAVEEVPPSDPAPWEHGVALGRLFPAQRGVPARLVIYRRPISHRAPDESELAALVNEVVTEQVARMLGRDPEELL